MPAMAATQAATSPALSSPVPATSGPSAKPGSSPAPVIPPELLRHAGATFDDGGAYTWRIEPTGVFTCVGQPKTAKLDSRGAHVTPTSALQWNQLCGMALAQLEPAAVQQPAPAAPAAAAPTPAPPTATPAPATSSGFSFSGFLTSLVDIGSQVLGLDSTAQPAAPVAAAPATDVERPAVPEPEPRKPVPATWENITQDFNSSIQGTSMTWHNAFYMPSVGRHVELDDLKDSKTTIEDIIANVEKQAVALQGVIDHFGKAIVVHCWVRPPFYNKKVGGASNSSHLRGAATDFHLDGMVEQAEEIRTALKADPSIYPGAGENNVHWMHLDIEHTKWFTPG
jgi:hypothetical protein